MIHVVLIIIVASAGVTIGQIMEIGKCPRIHVLRFACGGIDRPVGRERDLRFLVFTLLGRNQHYAIGCLCSVDRGGSRIFQYRNTFHIGRVNHIGIHLHTVDQHQGAGRVDGGSTTDIESVSFARCTVIGRNIQVTDHTLQSLAEVRDRTAFECLRRNTGYDSGQIRFLLRTITHHHYFVQCFGIFFEGDLQMGLSGNGYDLCFHPDKGDFKLFTLICINREVTFDVGNSSPTGSTFDLHRSSGQGETCVIENTAGYFLFLLCCLHHSGRFCIVVLRSKARLKSHTRKKDKHPRGPYGSFY